MPQWVVFGDGPGLARIRAEVKRRGMEGRVHYLGFDARVRGFLRQADAFVLSSKTEGLGTSVDRVLDDRAQARRLADAARVRVEQFDIERTVDRTERLYRELLAR